jgi:capsular polysaccharide transport system permease protein
MDQTVNGQPRSLLASLRQYFRVLRALLRLEEEHRRQAPMDSIVNLLEPVLLIITLAFLFYFLDRRQVSPLGGPPILFFSTGFFPLYFFIYVSRRMKGSIDLPRSRFPIEQRLDLILVHVILRIIDYAILAIILFGGIYLIYTPQAIPDDLGKVLGACAALVALGFGWGTLNLVLSRVFKPWNFIFPLISRGLMMFSGVFFVPEFLTPTPRYWLSFNPVLQAIELFRLAFYPAYPAFVLDLTYLAYCAVSAVFFGLIVERVTRRVEGP